jgi:DNA-binding Lrp family transcriptional regulator
MRAYILITTKPGTSEEVLKAIKSTREIKGVVQADSVYGRYDAIVVIEGPDLKSLSEVIYKVVEKNPNITHTETAITLF